LVQIKGLLLGVSTHSDDIVFDVQSGLHRLIATMRDQENMDELPAPGSTLELTGVYVGQGGNRMLGRRIDSFKLLLESGRDVRIVARPPWWTFRRLMLVVGMLIGVLLAALVWINLLHRKVEQRTAQLGDQIRQREVEQERTRVAQDLHDDLGGGLTEVNMLISLIQSPTTTPEEKSRYIDELNALALRMVDSLDEIVWAINPRNDTVTSLADYFGLYAQRLMELASVGCGLDVPENLPDQPLAPRFRQELFLAFKEALINAVRHANATKVWVQISIEKDEMVVIVSDDGCGIMPGKREAGSDGLANMRARMEALGGTCDIQSSPDKGTTVRLQATIFKV
jgi:signal transduction histidine kinase